MFPFHDERGKLELLVPRLAGAPVDLWLPVDDGSHDGGAELLAAVGIHALRNETRRGIGFCLRRVVHEARARGAEILVVMAGNNKDDPAEIARLLAPLLDDSADYVQGSRFLPGGSSPHLPPFRRVAIQLLSLWFRLYTGRSCTDLTNGFRAYRLSILDHPDVNIEQDWLDDYEFEYYVHWKAYKLGFRTCEVPVTKTYPGTRGVEYSKVKPFTGWWRMLRPFVFLGLGIKK
jgi:dolichol-phosphate mannosyltransferase